MKTARSYIVTKGGRLCALARVEKLRRDVLIVGAPVAWFAKEAAAVDALEVTLQSTSQLRGMKWLKWAAKNKARLMADAKLFAVLPVEAAKE